MSLAGLKAQAQMVPEPPLRDSTAFIVAPASVLEAHAGKSGILAGLGHEHRVRAHAFAGTVVYFPEDPGRSRVRVTLLTDSLRVVPEADSADIPEITRTMREKTLRVDSFPEIRFASSSVAPLPAPSAPPPGSGERGAVVLRVSGDLTMVGVTRPVTVDLTLEIAGDTLRAQGAFVVKQTDFGIRPFSKALGMVKVKNEVRLELRVVAARAQLPADADHGHRTPGYRP
jgi:polyisoprenoid-binding protein YceI